MVFYCQAVSSQSRNVLFVAVRTDLKGVLVLSEFTGAARELSARAWVRRSDDAVPAFPGFPCDFDAAGPGANPERIRFRWGALAHVEHPGLLCDFPPTNGVTLTRG